MSPDWLQAAIDHAIDPLTNGVVAGGIAVLVGLVVFFVFRLVGQPLLNHALIPFFRGIDRILVQFIAPMTGVGFKKTIYRWSSFVGIFLALTAIAIFAPVFAAIGAVFFGILGVLAIYRTWEHDEQERQIAEDNGQDVPAANDLGNEIIVGLIFLIVFFTLGFSRLSEQSEIYQGQAVFPVATTATYIWGEILKAVPMVDASEVYGIRNISGLEASGGAGKTLNFVFRAFLDLLLITSLFRLVSVFRRRTSGRDLRRIRTTLREGNSDEVEAAIATLHQIAQRGALNAQNELLRISLREAPISNKANPELIGVAANALLELGAKLGAVRFHLAAVEGYRHLLYQQSNGLPIKTRIGTLNNLGLVLSSLSTALGDPQKLDQAIDAHREALSLMDDEQTDEWASTQNALGIALLFKGRSTHDLQYIIEAIDCFQAALSTSDMSSSKKIWFDIMTNMGNAFTAVGEMTRNCDFLNAACRAYEETLKAPCSDEIRFDRQTAQMNLSNALARLGEYENDLSKIDLAISGYREVLAERGRSSGPRDWAFTMFNLGTAFQARALQTQQDADFMQACETYRAALEPVDQKSTPGVWKRYSLCLAVALESWAKFKQQTADWITELALLKQALGLYRTMQQSEESARVLYNIGNTSLRIGETRKDIESLEQAILAFRESISLWNKASLKPIAMTRNNLGNALRSVGVLKRSEEMLNQAVLEYEQSLDILVADEDAYDRAIWSRNLAYALQMLEDVTQDFSYLERAIDLYRNILSGLANFNSIEKPDLPSEIAVTQHNAGIAVLNAHLASEDKDLRIEGQNLLKNALSYYSKKGHRDKVTSIENALRRTE